MAFTPSRRPPNRRYLAVHQITPSRPPNRSYSPALGFPPTQPPIILIRMQPPTISTPNLAAHHMNLPVHHINLTSHPPYHPLTRRPPYQPTQPPTTVPYKSGERSHPTLTLIPIIFSIFQPCNRIGKPMFSKNNKNYSK
jgi:hypothetical protein